MCRILRKKIFHLPIGIWFQLTYLISVLFFCVWLRNFVNIAVPVVISLLSFILILKRRFRGYLCAYVSNFTILILISQIMAPGTYSYGYNPFALSHKIIAFMFLFFAVISTLALQANRRWFDEIYKLIEYPRC